MLAHLKTLPRLSGSIRILPLDLLSQKEMMSLAKSSMPTVLLSSSLLPFSAHYSQFLYLKANLNLRFVPSYCSLLELCEKDEGKCLLIGNNQPEILQSLNESKYITLQEICKAIPQKVPLSLRSKDTAAIKSKLQERMGLKIQKESGIPISNIMCIHQTIRKWDEAIQLILDYQPSPFHIPFYISRTQNKPQEMYKLTINDFIQALTTIHRTVCTAVQDHPPLKIVRHGVDDITAFIKREVATKDSSFVVDERLMI